MSKQVGIWIDHRRAVMVSLVDGREAVEILESGMEKHVRAKGGSRSKLPYGPQDVMKEDGRERKFQLHLRRWYDTVAARLETVDALLVFGPGEAKNEFQKHVEGTSLAAKIVAVETVDKMTQPQIAAKVRDHFLPKDSLIAAAQR